MSGKVLLLGSRHDEVTLLHYAEYVASFDGRRIARYKLLMAGVRDEYAEIELSIHSRAFECDRRGTPISNYSLRRSIMLRPHSNVQVIDSRPNNYGYSGVTPAYQY
jgi:hypothetical protein